MAPMQYFKITNVIDNGDNITIAIEDQAYTLTEMGYGPGNSTNFYGPRFLSLEVYFGIKKDIFNVTLNDLIGLIPLLNTPASDLVFSVFFEQFVLHLPPGTLSMYTVREIIGMYFYYLETATSSWFYTGDIQIWSDSINTLTGDFSFTTLNDYSGDVNGLIGGSVSLNSNSFEHEIINAVDLGAIIEITLAPYSYNNLTDLGYSGGESAIFYAPSYIFDLNFLDGTLHGLIHEIVGILNYTAGTYIPFLNIFMDIDSTQWDALSTGYPSFHDLIEYLTVLYYIDSTIQLRVVIDTIGEEMIIPYYGITGTPINISMKFSIDTENWIDIPVEILSLSNAIGLNCDFFIIDPSTTPGEWFTAFPQQIGMSYGLIMANSYDWADFNTEETIPAGLGLNLPGLTFLQDLEEISFGISWTANGILDELVINYGGEQIARIGSPAVIPTMNIPGFDLPILIGISAIGAIGVIYIVMKKKRI